MSEPEKPSSKLRVVAIAIIVVVALLVVLALLADSASPLPFEYEGF